MDTLRLSPPTRAAARAVTIALVAAAAAALPLAATEQSPVTGDLPALRAEALAEANAARRENGLDPLDPGETLDAIAQAHAEDMLERDYFAHVSPDGADVGDRFRGAGGTRSEIVAENLASCTGCPIPPGEDRVEAFQQGWMESPAHRENLLRRGIDRFGFGVAADPESRRTVAVQTFAGPGVPRALGAGETAEALDPAAQVEAALAALSDLREEAGATPLQVSPALAQAARALAPEADVGRSAPDLAIADALPPDARIRFSEIVALAATCTGCGAEPTAADIADFVSRWGDERRETLTDARFDRLGFALRADGAGAKTAVLVLGARR